MDRSLNRDFGAYAAAVDYGGDSLLSGRLETKLEGVRFEDI